MQRGITMTMELWNEAWTREDAANECIHELEFYVEDLEMDNAILHEKCPYAVCSTSSSSWGW